ncbi:YtxH domain-containing protein [uncultured Microscilla sp.]|uniref:YtxH domain-containing protein n=1 Tax=uncultured Microscilla sp. TaxID=432653 RepID=UPI002619FCF3|nr:YtxH domain-containing protein [uncultured Microscilla sp.]
MSKLASAITAFVAGTAVGAAVGILYAPEEGNKTRDKLTYRLSKLKDKVAQLTEELTQGKEEITSEAKIQGKKVVGDLEARVQDLNKEFEELTKQIRKD